MSAGLAVADDVIYLSSSPSVADLTICDPNARSLANDDLEEIVASIFSTLIKPLRPVPSAETRY